MTNFDDKLKSIAKRETIQTPEGFEKRMDAVIDSIPKQKNIGRFSMGVRRAMIAAVIVVSMVLAGGVVYASGIISFFSYNWDGTVNDIVYEENATKTPITFSQDYVPESDDEYAFRQDIKSGEIRRIGQVREDGLFYQRGSSSGTSDRFESLGELQNVLKDAELPLLKTPTYLPPEYSINFIDVNYYLSPDIIDPYMTPSDMSISKNGNEMQIFKIPEAYKKYVAHYHISLVNKDGNYLDIFAHFNQAYEKTEFDVSPEGSVTSLNIDGYEHCVYVSDSYTDNDKTYTNSYIAAEEEMDDVGFYEADMLDYNRSTAKDKPEPRIYDNIRYQFYVSNDTNIDESEMLKIIESLKLPNE